MPPRSTAEQGRTGPLITQPAPNDVLFGRGYGKSVHTGNRIFRDLINAHRREYSKARVRDKTAISIRIVQEVKTKYGGRFLKKCDGHDDDDDSKGWYEVDDRSSRAKVSQALRLEREGVGPLVTEPELGLGGRRSIAAARTGNAEKADEALRKRAFELKR
jgi:hypothetical protein